MACLDAQHIHSRVMQGGLWLGCGLPGCSAHFAHTMHHPARCPGPRNPRVRTRVRVSVRTRVGVGVGVRIRVGVRVSV